MKALSTLVSVVLLSACGHNNAGNSTVATAADKVQTLVSCSGDDASFVIRTTAAPTAFQGVLKYEGERKLLNCKQDADASQGASDAAEGLWSCVEHRNGDGRFLVSVHTQGLTAAVLADIKLEQIFPLEPKNLTTLGCKL